MARAQVRAPAPDDQDQQAAGDDNEAPESQGDSSDSPILDLSDAAVKRMIKLAKARGFVTLDELNAVLPSDETSPEQIEDIMAMLNEMGINVVESEEETENLTAKVEAEAEGESTETALIKVEAAKTPADRTDDPVRMYLREMGQVELLSREGEIAIAKRIEAGREAMIAGLCESPLTFQAIIIWRDELNEAKILLRDIIDLEATYAGPDAKKQGPVQTPAPYVPPKEEVKKKAEAKRAEAKRVAAAVRRPSADDEFGDVLSPEDFDKPQVEEEDDDEGDDLGVSLSAMEAELKPKVLEIFDNIAKSYKSLRKLQDQEVAEGTELSPSQERRYKKLREEIVAEVKSLSLNNARIEALVEQLYDINKRLNALEGRLLRLAVNEANLPVMGRNAQGPVLLRLLPGETVVGAAGVAADGSVLLASRGGQLKRLAVNSLRRCQRGDLGQIGVRFAQRGDQLIDLREDNSPVVAAVLSDGRSLRLDTAELEAEDDTGSGQPLGLGGNEAVAELVPLLS